MFTLLVCLIFVVGSRRVTTGEGFLLKPSYPNIHLKGDELNGLNIEQDTHDEIKLSTDEVSTIYFVYDQDLKHNISATLDNTAIIPVSVERWSKTGVIKLDPVWLRMNNNTEFGFGTYNLIIESKDWNNKCVVTVYFEEDLEGLKINVPDIFEVNDDVSVIVTLTKGSNYHTTLYIRRSASTQSESITSTEVGANYTQIINLTISEAGDYSLHVSVENNVHSLTETKMVSVIYKINGFTVTEPSPKINILSAMIINTELNSNANLEMGNVTFLISYGDNQTSCYTYESVKSLINGVNSSHMYRDIGNYSISFSISNPVDIVTYTFYVNVVDDIIPLPDNASFAYTVSNIKFPLSTNIRFVLSLNANVPVSTSVTCIVYFGPFTRYFYDADIRYGHPIITDYKYYQEPSDGYYNTYINCYNNVSSITTKYIRVYPMNLNFTDFDFDYRRVIPLNMTNSALKLDIEFKISLPMFDVLPTGVTFNWNFGDGSQTMQTTLSTLTVRHTFTERGRKTVSVQISWNGNSHYRYLPINIGVLFFTLDKQVGRIQQDTFVYSAFGLLNGTYNFFCKHGESVTLTGDVVVYNVTYSTEGSIYPYVIGSNGTYTLKAFIKDEVFYDVKIEALHIHVSNHSIDQPPGKVQVRIELPKDAYEYKNVKCLIDMNDFINRTVHKYVWNFTATNPIVLDYTYMTLGRHAAKIECTNPLTSIVENHTIESVNDCFKVTGIFDRQYSNEKTPMIVSTSADISLSNRMPVLCPKDNPKFDWTFYLNSNDTWTEINKTLPNPPTGTVRFTRGEMTEGLYKITLKVSVSGSHNTYVIESTYLKFQKPHPFAYIAGGSQRVRKFATHQIDGLTMSYDAEKGVGWNDNLKFSWLCKRYKSESLANLLKHLRKSSKSYECYSLLQNATQGIATLKATSRIYKGYALTVSVCVDSVRGKLCSNHTQLLQTLYGNPPDTTIRCELNCRSKYAVTSNMIVKALCDDCNEKEVSSLSYLWSLRRAGGTYVYNFDETGTKGSSLNIKPNILSPGKIYYLSVKLYVTTRNTSGESVIEIKTNYPPYGGNCTLDPRIGNATTTPFRIYCSGWKDEGSRSERNSIVDGSIGEPLIYEYISITRRSFSFGKFNITMPLFKGGESTASEILLSLGDEYNDYWMTISVRVYDYYGDVEVYNTSVQVFPDESMIPKHSRDTEALNRMWKTYRDNYEYIEAGGNIAATVQVIGCTASLLNANLSANRTTLPDTQDIDTGETITEKKTSIVESFSKQILVNLQSGFGEDNLNAADVAQISRSMETCIDDPNTISDQTTNNSINVAERLANDIKFSIDKKQPFPIDKINAIDECTDSIAGVLDKVLNNLIPDELFDEGIGSDDEDDRVTDQEPKQRKKRDIQDKNGKKRLKEDLAKRGSKKIASSLNKLLEAMIKFITYGQPERVISKDNLELTVEKIRENKGLYSKRGKKFRFDFNFTDGHGFEIGTTYFHKSPFIHGKGASRVKSSISIFTKDVTGNVVNIPMSVTINNKDVAYFNKYSPVYDPDDPEKMIYIVYTIKDPDDSSLIYIKPDEFDSDNFQRQFQEHSAFTLYADSGLRPTTKLYSFKKTITVRDWEHPFGFKLIIEPGLLKSNLVFLGLRTVKDNHEEQRSKRSLADNETNQVEQQSTNSNHSNLSNTVNANISMLIMTTGCRVWNEDDDAWVSSGCKVSPLSTVNETVCKCPKQSTPSTVFATTFYVPPNTIHFDTVFAKFDISNASVYGTVICLLIFYLLMLIWARRQDKKDVERWSTYFLCDNDEEDEYFYIITVHTGLRVGAGTKSNINFNLVGEEMETGIRLLCEGDGKGFETGSVRKFVMTTQYWLGHLSYLHIWHDNSGSDNKKSWYLHKIQIDDLQINERTTFYCDQWLALEKADGLLERTIAASSCDELNVFSRLFSGHARSNLVENHMLMSVVMRPVKSSFTRCQRLSTLFAFLFLTMITSAMFYSLENGGEDPSEVQIGFLRFSLKIIYVSVVSILITTPPTLLIIFCFKYTKKSISTCLPDKYTSSKNTNQLSQKNAISDDIYIKSTSFKLPRCSLYIAWILLALSILASGFFLILFSMEWGKSKSEAWLASFAFSFLESTFVIDPIKIIAVAVIASLICKSNDEKPQIIDLNLMKNEVAKIHNNSSRSYIALRADVLFKKEPSLASNMTQMKERLLMEMRAKTVLLQLIVYGVYAFTIYSISFVNRDERCFNLKYNIENYLVKSSKHQFGFSKVNTGEKFYHWMNVTLFPVYFPVADYNGDSISVTDKLYFGDFVNLRVGPARLRQVRMKKSPCPYKETLAHPTCVMQYVDEEEDTGSYCFYWSKLNKSHCNFISKPFESYFTIDAWRYTRANDIWGMAITGEYNTYSGGGYIVNFEKDSVKSRKVLNELKKYNWIDRQTRAVFMEYTLYNANVNLFTYVIFLLEFTETGEVLPWTDFQTFRPYEFVGATGTYVIFCYLIYLVVLLVGTIKTIIRLKSEGLSYLWLFWNKVDIFCYFQSYMAISVWVLRLIYTQKAMAKYYDNKETFINFQHIVVFNYIFNIFVGILLFVATCRILRILGYNKRFTQVFAVLSRAWKGLLGFGLLLSLLLFAYAILGYFCFGRNTVNHRSIFESFGSLANTVIGKNSVQSMVEVSKNFALFYYITYVFVVIFIFISVFVAILNESISAVKAEIEKQNTYGITDVIKNTLKSVLWWFPLKRRIPNKKNERETSRGLKVNTGRNLEIDTINIVSLVRETFESVEGFKDIPIPDNNVPSQGTSHVPLWKLYIPKKKIRHSYGVKNYQKYF